ncbi:MAG TPA: M48 family metallopeptidase [Streptosporangiaceae bacterium]|jgi:Zn-dependent protease with chaperone function
MTTTLRATLAIALLIGFYALVGVIIAATVAFDVLAIQHPHAGAIKLAVIASIAAFALLRALLMVGTRQEEDEYGFAVRPADEPVLWREVTELAGVVGTAPPEEIRLVPDVNAAVSEDTRMLGLRAVKRTMYIGLPLLATLTVAEMRGVLGHELGHYSGAHTRLGAPTYRGRVALIKAISGLGNHPILRRIFVTYAKLYFRVSQAVSRQQEHEADEFAVRISGRQAAGSALSKVHAAGAAWEYYLNSYVSLGGAAKATPRDLFGGFRALLAAQAQRFAEEAASQERSPYDSHPSLPERLAAIARLPEPTAQRDDRPAVTLLTQPAAAEHVAQQAMWTPEARQLPSLPWEEIIARGMYASANAEAVADLLVGAQRITGWPEPVLGGALAVLAHGDVDRLGAELRNLGWQGAETRALVATVLAGALQGVFVETGKARWTLSWSGPARLLDERGEEVELTEVARRAVDDTAALQTVRQLLARYDIPESHRPAQLPVPAGPA